MTDTRPRYADSDIATLTRRLDDGWQRIERVRDLGQDVTNWEDFWIDLLHQYEAAFDQLDPVGEEPDF